MKVRTGFVSNSSSSSFVIKKGECINSALELAEIMIPLREWEGDQKLLEKVEKLKTTNSDLPNVCFSTCNYDTYIATVDGYLVVSTCHNHNNTWEDVRIYGCNNYPQRFTEQYGEEYFDYLNRYFEFYHLEHDVTGHRAETYNFCRECYNDYWNIDGKVICPKCKKEMV